MSTHDYSITLREGVWEVKVSPTTRYGYFEHDDGGEGGLWFERVVVECEGGDFEETHLYDYDGYPYLPKGVATALRGAGFIVGPEFD